MRRASPAERSSLAAGFDTHIRQATAIAQAQHAKSFELRAAMQRVRAAGSDRQPNPRVRNWRASVRRSPKASTHPTCSPPVPWSRRPTGDDAARISSRAGGDGDGAAVPKQGVGLRAGVGCRHPSICHILGWWIG
jgi:hypothetical protein